MLAADKTVLNAARDGRLAQLGQQFPVAVLAVPTLGDGRKVGTMAVQIEVAEPAVGEIELQFRAEPPR